MAQEFPKSETVERAPREHRRSSSAVWVGVALLIVGLYMLADNLGFNIFNVFGLDFEWWALFLLIPGALVLKNAYDAYKAAGDQFTRTSRTQLVTGAALIIFAIMFMLDISMSMLLPVGLIVVGALLLLNVFNR